MAQAIIDIVIKYFPRFKGFFKRGDAFDDNFYEERVIRSGTYNDKNEGKTDILSSKLVEKKNHQQ